MDMRKRWQDKLNLVLGAWMFLSPFILLNPYSPIQFDIVTGHSFLMGLAIMLVAVAAIYRFYVWEEWLEAVLGVWLIVSPFVLGFSNVSIAMYNHIIVGLIIAADAIWVLLQNPPSTRAT